MSRSIALVSIILVMSLATPNAEATRYIVEPVALSNGYAISGGFIETNTSGLLMLGDITDYQITVEGEVAHTFSPSNLGSSIYISGTVSAIDGQIILPALPDDAPNRHFLAFSSRELSHRDCEICSQGLTYSTGNDLIPVGNGRVRYTHYELIALHENIFFAPTAFHLPQSPYVVATVPEPSTVTLIILGVCICATMMQRKA